MKLISDQCCCSGKRSASGAYLWHYVGHFTCDGLDNDMTEVKFYDIFFMSNFILDDCLDKTVT